MGKHGFDKVMYRGAGCNACEGSGYSGRTAIVEILKVTSRVRDLINAGEGAAEITRAALEENSLRTLTHDVLWHLSKGHTDLAEISPYLVLGKEAAAAEALPGPVTVPAAAPQSAQASAGPAGKLRVLIAEDDAVVRLVLKKIIEAAGFEVIETADGEEALMVLASGAPPDLLLSDIHMPRMNGFDLIKSVRETLGITDMPVIMLTTESSNKSQELAFKLGADDYIIKPFNGPLVIARIRATLHRARGLRQA